MVLDVVPQALRSQFGQARRQVALGVAVEQAGGDKGDQADRQDPGEGEVPAPSGGEAVGGGNGRPMRKGAALDTALRVGPAAEQSGGRDPRRSQFEIALALSRSDLEPSPVGIGTIIAPVEPRVTLKIISPLISMTKTARALIQCQIRVDRRCRSAVRSSPCCLLIRPSDLSWQLSDRGGRGYGMNKIFESFFQGHSCLSDITRRRLGPMNVVPDRLPRLRVRDRGLT